MDKLVATATRAAEKDNNFIVALCVCCLFFVVQYYLPVLSIFDSRFSFEEEEAIQQKMSRIGFSIFKEEEEDDGRPMMSKLAHLLLANLKLAHLCFWYGTLSTTIIFYQRGHYYFSSPPTESCFPLTFTRAPAGWGTRRMPIVMFCDEGVSAATTFIAKEHPQYQ